MISHSSRAQSCRFGVPGLSVRHYTIDRGHTLHIELYLYIFDGGLQSERGKALI